MKHGLGGWLFYDSLRLANGLIGVIEWARKDTASWIWDFGTGAASTGPRSFERGKQDNVADLVNLGLASTGPRSFERGKRKR